MTFAPLIADKEPTLEPIRRPATWFLIKGSDEDGWQPSGRGKAGSLIRFTRADDESVAVPEDLV